MAVVNFEITNREQYAGGRSFGSTGSYERIDGIVHYVIDPTHARNAQIVDLELAPRDENGRVRFHGDVCLLAPSDPSRGNGRLFMEAPNRGTKLTPGYILRADAEEAESEAIPSGDGFLFKQGYTDRKSVV